MIHRCQLMRFYQCPLSARFGRAIMSAIGRKAATPENTAEQLVKFVQLPLFEGKLAVPKNGPSHR